MAYCPQCRSEYRPEFTRCGDCEVDLVDRVPERPPLELWSEVFCGDSSKADVIRGALESAGIETLAPDDYASNLGWYAPSSIGRIRVLVRERDLPESKEIAAGLHRLDPEPAGPSLEGREDQVRPDVPPAGEKPLAESAAPSAQSPQPGPLGLGRLLWRSVSDSLLSVAFPLIASAPLSAPFERTFKAGEVWIYRFLLEPGFLVMAVWRRRKMIQAKEPVLSIWSGSTSQVFLGLLVGGIMVAYRGMYRGILEGLGVRVSDPVSTRDSSGLLEALHLLEAVAIAPLCEEAFFRGGILGAFIASSRRGWGILVSALLFALMHGSPYRMSIIFVDGIVLGCLFSGTRSLLAPILAHALTNAVILAKPFS